MLLVKMIVSEGLKGELSAAQGPEGAEPGGRKHNSPVMLSVAREGFRARHLRFFAKRRERKATSPQCELSERAEVPPQAG